MKKRLNENGMTLIELIVVIAILAILSAIVIPGVLTSINDSRRAADIASAKILADASARVLALEGKYAGFSHSGLNVNAFNDVFIEGDPVDDDFQAAVFVTLNKHVPVPKYNGPDIVEDNYIVTISSTRQIKIYIGSGVDISSGNALEVYPNPQGVYAN